MRSAGGSQHARGACTIERVVAWHDLWARAEAKQTTLSDTLTQCYRDAEDWHGRVALGVQHGQRLRVRRIRFSGLKR